MSATHLLCVSKWSLELNQLCPTAWLQSWMHCVFLNPRAINKRHLWHFFSFFFFFFPTSPCLSIHILYLPPDNSFHEFSLSHWHSLQNEASHSSSLSTWLFVTYMKKDLSGSKTSYPPLQGKASGFFTSNGLSWKSKPFFFFPLNSSLRSQRMSAHCLQQISHFTPARISWFL